MKPPFVSNEAFFQVVRELVARLDAGGRPGAAAELTEGLRCLNGLTDGWALFLESIEEVRAGAMAFPSEDREALERIRKAVRAAVCRR